MTKEQFLNGTSFYLPNEILRDEDTTYKYQEEMILKETRNRKGDVILRRYEANAENIKTKFAEAYTYVLDKRVAVKLKFEDLIEYEGDK